jgi:hypothetical protein
MAVYGPIRHQKNIMWTEADPYNIFLVTDRSIYCYMTRSENELFAILYFLSKIMQIPGRSIYYRSIYENSDRLR